MSYYIQALFIAIPLFTILMLTEMIVAYHRNIKINRAADMISSLSSGLTNILRDGIKFTFILISYGWIVDNISIYKVYLI